MGTPKSVYRAEPEKIPVAEMVRAFASAQNVAQFRTEEKRESALEQLRKWLAPMVQYLDKPIGDLLHSEEERKSAGSKSRAMILFDLPPRARGWFWLGIDRDGNWIIVERDGGAWHLMKTDGETLERLIWAWRKNFFGGSLGLVLKHYEEQVMEKAPELEAFTHHACFLGFIQAVSVAVDKLIKEREERLETMRGNLETVARFATALDPFTYQADLALPAYSVFFVRPGHTSRSSADYLVKEPVEQQVARCNATHNLVENERYEVDTCSYKVSSSLWFLERVSYVLKDALKNETFGSCGRTSFQDAEVRALEKFVQGACSFNK